MAKLTLDDIGGTPNFYVKVNENSRRIEAAIEEALLRTGAGPNFMSADLDMNGNNILNQRNVITLESFNWRGDWATATEYRKGDTVYIGGSSYINLIEHTSTVFLDDFNSGYWDVVVMAAGALPDQIGQDGKFLQTDGVNAEWVDVTTVADAVGTASTLVSNLDATLHSVAKSGNYSELNNKPTIPAAQVNSDWNAASGVAQILNKPTIPAAQVNSDWNAVSGISQILNKPTIITPVNADWNSVSGLSQILNKPALSFVGLAGNETIAGVKTFSSQIIPSSTQGIRGTTTNDNAITGSIGEFVIAAVPLGSAIAMANNTVANIASISLTAGDWDVIVSFSSVSTSIVTVNNVVGTASLTSLFIEPQARFLLNNPTGLSYPNSSIIASGITPMLRVTITGTTTVYYTAISSFSGGSLSIYGHIRARRIR